jgi:hypothetical protein
VWLALIDFFLADQIYIRVPILMCLLQQFRESLELLLIPGNQQPANQLKGTVNLFHEFMH